MYSSCSLYPQFKNVIKVHGSILKSCRPPSKHVGGRALGCKGWLFAMFGMATIHTEVLVFVRRLDVLVSLNLAVFQIGPCVEEYDLFSRPGGNKFNGWAVTVKTLNEGTY